MLIEELYTLVNELPLENDIEKEQYKIIIRYAIFKYLEMQANEKANSLDYITFFINTKLEQTDLLKSLDINITTVAYREKNTSLEGTLVQVPISLFKSLSKDEVLRKIRIKDEID